MQYYATLSHESDYSGTYDWKESVLSMNLVNLDNSGTTSVPYLVDYTDNEDGTAFTLAIDTKNNTESVDALYGMEEILEGSYKRLSLSDEQLTDVETQLGVPEDIETSVEQAPPQYWSSGQCWIVTVNIYDTDNTVIASAGVDPLTNELCRDILQYSSN